MHKAGKVYGARIYVRPGGEKFLRYSQKSSSLSSPSLHKLACHLALELVPKLMPPSMILWDPILCLVLILSRLSCTQHAPLLLHEPSLVAFRGIAFSV
jgi:hypothetical protein